MFMDEEFVAQAPRSSYLDIDMPRVTARQAMRAQGDDALVRALVDTLSAAITLQAITFVMSPTINVPPSSMLGQWLGVYSKALARPEFLAWLARHELVFDSVLLRGGVLEANSVKGGVSTAKVFTPEDDSGWREIAEPLIAASMVIDPACGHISVAGDPTRTAEGAYPLAPTLAFYGYPLPVNRAQAYVMRDELRRRFRFAAIDSSGCARGAFLVEQAEQAHDLRRVADELEQVLSVDTDSSQAFDWLAVYRRRVELTSGSMLANTMNAALLWLHDVTDKLAQGEQSSDVYYFFSFAEQTLIEVGSNSLPRPVARDRLAVPDVDADIRGLALHARKLGADVYSDGRFSVAAVLQAYGWERPLNEAALRLLVDRLRQLPSPFAPYVETAAHSVPELVKHLRYIALLNNRYRLWLALEAQAEAREDAETVDITSLMIESDIDSPLYDLVEIGSRGLQELNGLDEFKSIRTALSVAPDSHVLLSSSGNLGAMAVDGRWVRLTDAVLAVERLSGGMPLIALIASRAGGELRSNGRISLAQMLSFYNFKLPTTVKQVRRLALLVLSESLRVQLSVSYWNVLSSGSDAASPSMSGASEPFMPEVVRRLYHWDVNPVTPVALLSDFQRRQLIGATEQLMSGVEGTLFDYLAGDLIAGKSPSSIRAEAHLLLACLFARKRAQRLAGILSALVGFPDQDVGDAATRSRLKSLVLVALILSLDPLAGTLRNSVAGINLVDKRYWGASCSAVVLGIESALANSTGISVATAPLATHLLLAGVAPELLVRKIPDAMPYQCSQVWVTFKHLVAYLESKYTGLSLRLTFDNIMTWVKGYDLRPALWRQVAFSGPLIDWASANGVLLGNKEVFTSDEFNAARGAFLEQRTTVLRSVEVLYLQFPSRRARALNDLRWVFPDNDYLDQEILTAVADEGGTPSEQKVSFVDLHMAGQLTAGSSAWRSMVEGVDYSRMAERFYRLTAVSKLHGDAFNLRLDELHSAYVNSIQYEIANLSLPHRQLLEYGSLELYTLSDTAPGASRAEPLSRYGVIVWCEHPAFQDRAFEIFPGLIRVVEHADLRRTQFNSTLRARSWPVDLQAYTLGSLPRNKVSARVWHEKIDNFWPSAHDSLPDASTLGVPQSYTSPRIHMLVTSLLDKSLFLGSEALRESARQAVSLEQGRGGYDPWSEYFNRLAFKKLV
ncbi:MULTISPECIES: hypothetical protein [unclassified Pseudomonas]|uniref:hypothetical protein n=1 Tax=unclassified Pseudomonas TaxID=196821 RepID=UPI002AC9BD87|nr:MULTISPECIES: hypothetical protein [unclassified Pseudomonas]MEB0046906.1 hypothetical protein [Pseudomonas sp. Dout3]MEB0098618.1 hypothetical protein [Pseudomonas sp. DC1.2]WPX59584.1 hypothetical protein RHM68_02710 [Pseudomonas sp. DC1.2]